MFCTTCSQELALGANACSRCGSATESGSAYCQNCGRSVQPHSVACAACGRAVPKRIGTEIPGAFPHPASSLRYPSLNANPLTWPFEQKNWQQSLWMPAVWWFNPIFPLGLMLRKGWAVDAARRMQVGRPPLPEPGDLSKLLGNGLIIMVAEFFYFVIPLGLFALASQGRYLLEVWEIVLALWKFIGHGPQEPLWSNLGRRVFDFLVDSGGPVVYLAFATPMWAAAKVRLVVTGSAFSFLNLFASVGLIFRHFSSLLKYLFLSLFADFVSTSLLGASIITGPLSALVVIAIPTAKCWTSARFLGEFAGEVEGSLSRSR